MLRAWIRKALALLAVGGLVLGLLALWLHQGDGPQARKPAGAGAARVESLLYNPGPRWRAGVTLSKTPQGVKCNAHGSSIEDLALVQNRLPQRQYAFDCVGGSLSTHGVAGVATYSSDTSVGWLPEEVGKTPGWNVELLSGGRGVPILWRYTNRAKASAAPCTLREVGLVYQGWPYRPDSAFRVNEDNSRKRLKQYDKLEARFRARLIEDEGPPRCAQTASSYITVDFRIVYYNNDAEAKPVRYDLIGILLHRGQGSARKFTPEREEAIYWQSENKERILRLLVPDKLPVKIPPMSASFADFTIDYLSLLRFFPPPPEGFTHGDAVVTGFDIYTSVRGADLSFELTNVDLAGTLKGAAPARAGID